jgi:signal transduction histidine kinase
MELKRTSKLVYGLLLGAWLLVVGWQVEEHFRVVEAGKSDLRGRSHEIANTLSAVTRALRFRGAVFQERLEPVLNELVNGHTNALVHNNGLVAIGLLNTEGDPVVSAGNTNLLAGVNASEPEHWAGGMVIFVQPVEGANVNPEGATNNATVVIPPFHNLTNDAGRNPGDEHNREFPPRGPRPGETNGFDFQSANFPHPFTNAAGGMEMPPPGNENGDRPRGGNRRPPWMRGLSDAEFKVLVAKRELHGLVLAMSTENYRALCTHDGWLRCIIGFFAGISALGAGLAWRNAGRTAKLQIRLVRASELNSHLKEMNLAAAGLAHETRNPLNIIRGQAQMLSRLPAVPPAVAEKSKIIVDETDKVTAQLTEFINYSRPREVRRTKINLSAAIQEVIRTLNFDLEEKHLRVEAGGEALAIEADEQLLRQVLFNLLFNAVQAVSAGGEIKFSASRTGAAEAALEIRDDGPGVPVERRQEIFKPYFTMQPNGTGLGLAIVQQIVLVHGWEIVCLGNEPHGAVFRITHLKLAV